MKIAYFASLDTLRVRGNTAPFYTLRYLERRAQVRAFLVLEREVSPEEPAGLNRLIFRRSRFLPGLLHINVPAAWMLLRHWPGDNFLVYTYMRVIAPGLIGKLTGRPWVVDFQIPPLEQDMDYSTASGRTERFRLTRFRMRKMLLCFFYRFCDLAVTLNEDIRRILVEEYRIPEDKIHILPMGVDLERFAPSAVEPPWTPFRIIHVGDWGLRLLGVQDVLEAIARLNSGGIPVKLVLAGYSSTEEDNIQKVIDDYGVRDHVEFHGFVPHDRIPSLIATAHLGVSARHDILSQRASSPAKVMEYLAMGKPVIGSDVAAHRRVIRDCWNGLLFQAGCPEDLARKVKHLFERRELYGDMCRHARESVQDMDWKPLLDALYARLRVIMKS